MASLSNNFYGSAADSLGLGGQLSQQVDDDTEEMRKKRLQMLNLQGGPGSALGAVQQLFGRSQ